MLNNVYSTLLSLSQNGILWTAIIIVQQLHSPELT